MLVGTQYLHKVLRHPSDPKLGIKPTTSNSQTQSCMYLYSDKFSMQVYLKKEVVKSHQFFSIYYCSVCNSIVLFFWGAGVTSMGVQQKCNNLSRAKMEINIDVRANPIPFFFFFFTSLLSEYPCQVTCQITATSLEVVWV